MIFPCQACLLESKELILWRYARQCLDSLVESLPRGAEIDHEMAALLK